MTTMPDLLSALHSLASSWEDDTAPEPHVSELRHMIESFTGTVEPPAPKVTPMQAAYDAFFRAAEQLACVALFDVATTVRAKHPEAVSMRIDWSENGDYLEPSAAALDADGEPIGDDEWIDTDNASALTEDNRSTWSAYAKASDDPNDHDGSVNVFPLDTILTDLDPEKRTPEARTTVTLSSNAWRHVHAALRQTEAMHQNPEVRAHTTAWAQSGQLAAEVWKQGVVAQA